MSPPAECAEPVRLAPVWKELALPQAPQLAAVECPTNCELRAPRKQRGRQPRRVPRIIQATVGTALPLQAGGLDAVAQVALHPALPPAPVDDDNSLDLPGRHITLHNVRFELKCMGMQNQKSQAQGVLTARSPRGAHCPYALLKATFRLHHLLRYDGTKRLRHFPSRSICTFRSQSAGSKEQGQTLQDNQDSKEHN